MRRYDISQRFFINFAHLVLLHFVKIVYYIMRRYYISQQFFITLCIGITFRNGFLLRFVQVLHFATIFCNIIPRYYISQRFCITLCVGVTFRNVYYIMCFNIRDLAPISRENKRCTSQQTRITIVELVHRWLLDDLV